MLALKNRFWKLKVKTFQKNRLNPVNPIILVYFCAILFIPFQTNNAKRQKYSFGTDHR